MNEKHSGSCLCGEIKYEIDGDFESFYLCHCKYCQKDTGSAHAANLFSSSAKLKWSTGQDKVIIYSLPSTRHSRSFCSVCGSAVPTQHFKNALLVVPAGSLDSAVTIKANAHLFISSRASWDHDLEKLPCYDGLPT
ncbi:GFA family protein [Cyanobacterium sp. Dongsha4]|uniref:GFA family protein n=1 Tax=Cyanobacterium sp. DS4 TaxID=2878255 RepID=UPI002E81D415|nr:GFA family protein [Cyanobacterium sp. Dongsha4]WVL01243.1 GFA family protein [Cyanobacterium sp. Dongsha4]